jgi:hypothetical protein
MYNRLILVFSLCIFGCATQGLTVRVNDNQATRIGSVDRQRLASTDEREIARARDEIERAKMEKTRAEEMVRTVAGELKTTHDADVLRVLQVKQQWAAARLGWRTAQIESARLHELAAMAKDELDKAEIVLRNGVDLEVAPFVAQLARLHQSWSQYNVKLAAAHGAADNEERALAEAKSRYAHERVADAQTAGPSVEQQSK